MKTITTILLALLLLFVLAAAPAEAQLVVNKYTNDFTLSSPNNEQLKACACEIKPDLLIIENIGNFQAQFDLDIRSPVSDWMQLATKEFTLAPKQRNEIINYIQVPCGEVGTYEYTVDATNNFGRADTLSRTLRADVCQNIELSVEPKEKTANLCEAVDYHVRLRNVGTFAETYTLSFESYSDFIDVDHTEVYLQPGQEHTQIATLELPCTRYGDFDIPFVASAQKNMIEERTTSKLHVENQYDHSIDVQTSLNACTRVGQELPVTITNRIDLDNEFTIDIQGPRFLDTQTREITLGPEASETINLGFNAPPGEEGSYEITVRATSKHGDIVKTRTVDLQLEDCYDFATEMRDTDNQAISEDTACCGVREYNLNIRNQGTSYETYNLIPDAPSWFTPEQITVDLNPGESKNVQIITQVPCMDEEYNPSVTVVNNNFPEVNRTVDFQINAQTQRTCHYVGIDYDEFTITKDTSVVPVMVKHNGTQGGLYEVDLESEIFTLVEDRLELQPGQTKILHLETSNLDTKELGRYISQPIFTYTQDNNPTANLDRNVDYVEHVGTQLRGKGLLTRAGDWIANNWWAPGICGWVGILLLVIIALLILGLLTGARVPFAEHTGTIIKVMLVLLALLTLFVFATTLPSKDVLYEEPTGEHFVELRQNTQKTINLDQYFDDPDGDELTYTATQPKDIAIQIQDNTMKLMPDYGFRGVNELVITADDGFGGITDSPVLEIRVLEREELGILGFWLRYCLSINLVLLAIILLLLTGYIGKRKQKKPVEKKHKLLLPPRKPAKKTARTSTRKKAVKKATGKTTRKAVAKKAVRKAAVKKATGKTTRKAVAKKQSTRSLALDRALVSQEEHEMKQVLGHHNKRQTQQNITTLREALRRFKADKRFTPNNRETFYKYLDSMGILETLESKKRK